MGRLVEDCWVNGKNAGKRKRTGCHCAAWLVPKPLGSVFELIEFFLVNSEAMPNAAERRKPSGLRENLRSAISEA